VDKEIKRKLKMKGNKIFTFLLIMIMALFCSFSSLRADDKLPSVHGFLESDYGYKFKEDTTKHGEYNLLEQRLQLKTRYYPKWFLADWSSEVFFKGDFIADEYFYGREDFDLREFYTQFSPIGSTDVKIGRQILTWGTGDYLFINDVFPKDYVSFFVGRNDEYLKAPSDAVKVSLYNDIANLDIVAIPVFQPNIIPKGDRLSFFDSFQGGIAGSNSERTLVEPSKQFDNTEYALRLHRTFNDYESALYYFRGFYGVPCGYKSEENKQLFYPPLDVYGASLRGPILGGIGNIETGYYDSRNDRNGNDRLIQNSSFKLLTGYERDMGNDFRIGVQYLYEETLNYKNYEEALLSRDIHWDEYRHLLTLRLTKLLLSQTLRLGLFTFYSPSDDDAYLRPTISYDVNDHLNVTLGSNLIWGKYDKTEFGQMKRNSNVYFRVRYSF